MSCTISTSNEPENVWMIQNSIYEWFIKILIQRFGHDADISSQLSMSIYSNGISLDIVFNENPSMANRVTEAIRVVAGEVVNGKHMLVDDNGTPITGMQEKCISAFENLYVMLEDYKRKIGRHLGIDQKCQDKSV